jgi:Uma2 family endonuclease
MSLGQTTPAIEYPESDGKPMGETDLHRRWMIRILDLLSYRYRDERVYVSSDLLVYYIEGAPTKFVVPDDFVVKDCDPHERRTFKIWEEGKAPDVVFEVTSRSTQREDMVFKTPIYARMGVKELFLYDPTSDYLDPPLYGFRLDEGDFARIEADAEGFLACEQLGVRMRLEDGALVMYDAESGHVLLTESEAERAARDVERAAREAAEQEVRRLREELKRARGSD